MVELKHDNKTYYIEEYIFVDKFGNKSDPIYHLKRKRIWLGIITPFWKYTTELKYAGGSSYKIKKVFWSADQVEGYFEDQICSVQGEPYTQKTIVRTLNCNNEE